MPKSVVAEFDASRARAGQAALRPAEPMIAGLELAIPARISVATEAVSPMVTRLADSPPWNGGDRYTMRTTHGTDLLCTTGFGVNASGRTWILTAAHCGSLGDTAYQGLFPDAANRRMGPVNSDQWAYDMLLIDTSGWHLARTGGGLPPAPRLERVLVDPRHDRSELLDKRQLAPTRWRAAGSSP